MKLVKIFLATMLLLLLIGCGGGSDSSSTGSVEQNVTEFEPQSIESIGSIDCTNVKANGGIINVDLAVNYNEQIDINSFILQLKAGENSYNYYPSYFIRGDNSIIIIQETMFVPENLDDGERTVEVYFMYIDGVTQIYKGVCTQPPVESD